MWKNGITSKKIILFDNSNSFAFSIFVFLLTIFHKQRTKFIEMCQFFDEPGIPLQTSNFHQHITCWFSVKFSVQSLQTDIMPNRIKKPLCQAVSICLINMSKLDLRPRVQLWTISDSLHYSQTDEFTFLLFLKIFSETILFFFCRITFP